MNKGFFLGADNGGSGYLPKPEVARGRRGGY